MNFTQFIFADKIKSFIPNKEQAMKKKIILWVVVAIVALGLLIQLDTAPG